MGSYVISGEICETLLDDLSGNGEWMMGCWDTEGRGSVWVGGVWTDGDSRGMRMLLNRGGFEGVWRSLQDRFLYEIFDKEDTRKFGLIV